MNVYIYIMVLVAINMYLLFMYIKLNSKIRVLERDVSIANLMFIKHLVMSDEVLFEDLPDSIKDILQSIEEISMNEYHKNHKEL